MVFIFDLAGLFPANAARIGANPAAAGDWLHWPLWQISLTLDTLPLRAPLLQGKLVGNHGDELAIGGLVLLGRHPAAEGLVECMRFQRLHFIAIVRQYPLVFYEHSITHLYRGFGLQNSVIHNFFTSSEHLSYQNGTSFIQESNIFHTRKTLLLIKFE